MAIPSFDLVDVIRTIQKQKRIVIGVVVLSLVLAGVFLVIKKNKYKADAHFLVNNPIYADRGNLFRFRDTKFVDYYGGDDELDRVTALAYSDTVIDRIIWKADFQTIYRTDPHDPKGHDYLMTIFKKNFGLKRSEYKDIEVSYIAYDAQTAANVANMTVQVLEETYRRYFESVKLDIYSSINAKIKQLDKSIDSLTDSLSTMREKYGIYNILSPTRQNIVSGDIKGGKGMGRAVEEIQNIESIKDQLVSDRARYITTLNEFSTSANETMTLLKVITRALPPNAPKGPGVGLTLLVAGLLGLLFSVFFVLFMEYYRKLNAVLR